MRANNSTTWPPRHESGPTRTAPRRCAPYRTFGDAGHPVTYEAVASKAGVSRSWL